MTGNGSLRACARVTWHFGASGQGQMQGAATQAMFASGERIVVERASPPAILPAATLMIVVLFLLPAKTLFAGKPFQIGKVMDGSSLGTTMEVLEDKTGKLTIDDVIHSGLFSPPERKSVNYGFTSSAYWVRLAVSNLFDTKVDWFLEVNYPLIDRIDLYIPDPSGSFSVKKAGDLLPFDARELKYRNFVFPLQESPHGQRIYYMRFKSGSAMNLAVTAWSPARFLESVNREQIMLGLYYGTILALAVYNFFVFLSVRDKSYLYYVLFHSSHILFLFTLNGLAFQYFWPSLVWWANNCLTLFILFTVLFFNQFTRSFLNTSETTPVLDKMLGLLRTACALGMLASLVTPYSIRIQTAIFLAFISAFLAQITGFLCLTRGHRPARYFLIAWTACLFGVLLYTLKTISVLPENLLTSYAIQGGSVIEVILLSFALGDRMNIMKKEKEIAQQEVLDHLTRIDKFKDDQNRKLEEQIEERTVHLQEALKSLQETQKSLLESEKKAALTQVSAGIAHELNNPLNYIAGGVPNLRRRFQEMDRVLFGLFDSPELDEEGSRLKSFFENRIVESGSILNEMERGVKLAAAVIEELRGTTGVDGRVLEKVDLKNLIRTELGTVQTRFTQEFAGRKIGENLSTCGHAVVEANPYVLSQFFRNIFENACTHALQSTEPEVRVEVESKDGNTECFVRVSSNGPPIESGAEGKVPDMFCAAGKAGEGRGASLSFSRSLLESQGGEIFLSDNGRISGWVTFTIRIPSRPTLAPSPAVQTQVTRELAKDI